MLKENILDITITNYPSMVWKKVMGKIMRYLLFSYLKSFAFPISSKETLFMFLLQLYQGGLGIFKRNYTPLA